MDATTHNGGPAFPVSDVSGSSPSTLDELKRNALGMSLRDYFAAKALSGLLAYPKVSLSDHNTEEYAQHAYRLADAMLKARAAS